MLNVSHPDLLDLQRKYGYQYGHTDSCGTVHLHYDLSEMDEPNPVIEPDTDNPFGIPANTQFRIVPG